MLANRSRILSSKCQSTTRTAQTEWELSHGHAARWGYHVSVLSCLDCLQCSLVISRKFFTLQVMVVDDERLTGTVDSVLVYILTLMASDQFPVQDPGDYIGQWVSHLWRYSRFCIKVMMNPTTPKISSWRQCARKWRNVKRRAKNRRKFGIVLLVSCPRMNKNTVHLSFTRPVCCSSWTTTWSPSMSSTVMFVSFLYCFEVLSQMTLGCHFEDSKHRKHFEMSVSVGDKPDLGVNFVVPDHHYKQLDIYMKSKVSRVGRFTYNLCL